MNANDRGGCRLRRGLAVMTVAASCAARAQAEAPASVSPPAPPAIAPDVVLAPGWPDADIVDELLRRETRAALAAQEQRRGIRRDAMSATDPGAQADTQPDRIDLAAIYGVGKRLDVEVLVNGRRLRYRHGRKWPEEAPDGDDAYALRAIQGHCVTLDRVGGNRRVCLARGD